MGQPNDVWVNIAARDLCMCISAKQMFCVHVAEEIWGTFYNECSVTTATSIEADDLADTFLEDTSQYITEDQK